MKKTARTAPPAASSRANGSPETKRADGPPVLALRPKEAARALGIGERLLWEKTNQGLIPHLRIGSAVVYPVADLAHWLSEEAAKEKRR